MPFTARELYLISEAATVLRSLAYAWQTQNKDQVKKILGELADGCNVTIDERTRPQEWDVIYDKAHRYEPDHWIVQRKSDL